MSTSSDHQKRVIDFMRKAKQEIPNSPTLPEFVILRLRAKLIAEEAIELINALGFTLFCKGVKVEFQNLKLHHEFGPDILGIMDGCGDLSVVTIGTLASCGIPDIPVLELIDENNLAKFGPGHSIDPNGKLIKPPDHQPPDLDKLLSDLRSQGISL